MEELRRRGETVVGCLLHWLEGPEGSQEVLLGLGAGIKE